MNVHLRDPRRAVRFAGVAAVLAVAILAAACQPAPGAGSPTATQQPVQSLAAPAATPSSLAY